MDKSLGTEGESQLTYDSYLKITEVISLQKLRSDPPEHDEMLFIITHQVYELWFKQILHETKYSMQALERDEVIKFARSLNRVRRILDVLTHQIDILETMTPSTFAGFRHRINPASGFQSYQFRLLEYSLGAKDSRYLKFYEDHPEQLDLLTTAIESPSLYDHFLRLMKRRGFELPERLFEEGRDFSVPHTSDEMVTCAFLEVYTDSEKHDALYMCLEKMMDIDEQLLIWRYRHVAMVERMMGRLTGTGGSSGVKYLSATLSKRFFPEIWEVRNKISGLPVR